MRFSLDENDRFSRPPLPLEEPPTTIRVSRKADGGNVLIDVEPRPRKALPPLTKALTVLEKAIERGALRALVSRESTFGNHDAEGARDFQSELREFVHSVRRIVSTPEDGPDEREAAELAGELANALVPEPKANRLRDALKSAKVWLERDDPSATVVRALWKRTPQFLAFDDPDRSLQSEYALDDALLARTPIALENLARMAGLDLHALNSVRQSGDIARRDSALREANNRLRDLFRDAWRQSKLRVELTVDGDYLRVSIVENDAVVTVFGERSAGLRMFVALVAFLSTRDTQTPPILLIDEAESHLHIDAQADLVNMFVSQEQVARVIYTTHSPACLPPDLGVGIRSVVPSAQNSQVSEIRNSFWTGGAGYSPLMIAMGAAAAAFTPARCVVLAEGATEMILLPSLLRGATGLEVLPYQVAPGLSEVPRDFYPSLDMEGAKVAYLLDGDAGGELLKDGLLKHGVPRERIVMLPVPGVENLLLADEYLAAVSKLIAECNGRGAAPALPRLGAPARSSWATQLGKWAVDNNMAMPSKVAVANRIVEDNKAIPSDDYASSLRALHELILKALSV